MLADRSPNRRATPSDTCANQAGAGRGAKLVDEPDPPDPAPLPVLRSCITSGAVNVPSERFMVGARTKRNEWKYSMRNPRFEPELPHFAGHFHHQREAEVLAGLPSAPAQVPCRRGVVAAILLITLRYPCGIR